MIAFADEQTMRDWAATLATKLRIGDSIGLSGPLGAGKTSIARAMIQALGYEGEVASPSFAIIHHYDPPEVRLPLLHCDFYRLEDPAEADELGLEDQSDDAVIIAEWPEMAGGMSGPNHLGITIAVDDKELRSITLNAGTTWKERLRE
ncbi:MAG: tRNA (adenosine(37)-N6)-threonylcarbamoyltransferase complex ATPase subunit type 1 TsaE [Pseudomonadota bacterium]